MARQPITFETSSDVRRYIASLIIRLEKGMAEDLTPKMAETLSNLAYKIQMSISGELKEREIANAEKLANELERNKL